MARTNELRAMLVTKLNSIKTQYNLKGIYYQIAQDDAMYPHIVFDFDSLSVLSDDRNRRDIKLIVDMYDKGASASNICNIADAVEDLLDCKNIPLDGTLPTIYIESRRNVPDSDKQIRHTQIRFTIQNYERN